jgi:hypothetical protein
MPHATKGHSVKVSGLSDELINLIDARVRERHAAGRSEYIRDLIHRDVLSEPRMSLRQILAPVHAEGRALPDTDEDLEAMFEEARNEVYREKHGSRDRS